jgi:hypothetical protein
MAECVGRLREAGIWMQLRPPGGVLTLHRAWSDPTSTLGITVELCEGAEVAEFTTPDEAAEFARDGAPTPGAPKPAFRRFLAVGHAVHDIEAAAWLYGEVLGFTPEYDAPVVVDEERLLLQRFALPNGIPVDVVQPLGGRTIIQRRLDSFGEGMAYLKLEANDLDALTARLTAMEAWLQTPPAGEHLPRRTWVHERSTDGLPLMLVPANDDA